MFRTSHMEQPNGEEELQREDSFVIGRQSLAAFPTLAVPCYC